MAVRRQCHCPSRAGGTRRGARPALGKPFHVVLVGTRLSDGDGFELARRVREDAAAAGATLVLLASPGDAVSQERLRGTGAAVVLRKPLRRAILRREIVSLVSGAAGVASREGARGLLRAAPARVSGSRGRVLVAEDNVTNQKLVVRLLEKLGFTADVVSNGVEVLRALAQRPYDAVLMDCQMPEMDGYDATVEIRRREERSGGHLPIIALTANAMEGDRDRCLDAGMDDYMAKPIRPAALGQALDRWVRTAAAVPCSSTASARTAPGSATASRRPVPSCRPRG